MSGRDVTLETSKGRFSAYFAAPPSGKGAGVVVIQEIFGVNPVMRDLVDRLAAEGYFALCPDLFWRIEPGIQLTDRTPEEWKKAFELFSKFDVDAGTEDVQATLSYVRGISGCSGKAGVVGYCLGGLLSYLSATRTDADASVGYYGVNIHERLDEAGKIRKPLMLHVAARDQFVPPAAQEKIRSTLAVNPLVTIHVYDGQDHAFARRGGEHYDAAAAKLADERTSEFFKQYLG